MLERIHRSALDVFFFCSLRSLRTNLVSTVSSFASLRSWSINLCKYVRFGCWFCYYYFFLSQILSFDRRVILRSMSLLRFSGVVVVVLFVLFHSSRSNCKPDCTDHKPLRQTGALVRTRTEALGWAGQE